MRTKTRIRDAGTKTMGVGANKTEFFTRTLLLAEGLLLMAGCTAPLERVREFRPEVKNWPGFSIVEKAPKRDGTDSLMLVNDDYGQLGCAPTRYEGEKGALGNGKMYYRAWVGDGKLSVTAAPLYSFNNTGECEEPVVQRFAVGLSKLGDGLKVSTVSVEHSDRDFASVDIVKVGLAGKHGQAYVVSIRIDYENKTAEYHCTDRQGEPVKLGGQ
ncbi:MAG: hypothetical protein ACP5NX_02575 [Candidatus Bilamarchaeaceae archaeon]